MEASADGVGVSLGGDGPPQAEGRREAEGTSDADGFGFRFVEDAALPGDG